MARVAVVTGGTRGIGRAISVALKGVGYKVAANYASNEAAAMAFSREPGIPAYKFDVSDYKACADGVKCIVSELEILGAVVPVSRDQLASHAVETTAPYVLIVCTQCPERVKGGSGACSSACPNFTDKQMSRRRRDRSEKCQNRT